MRWQGIPRLCVRYLKLRPIRSYVPVSACVKLTLFKQKIEVQNGLLERNSTKVAHAGKQNEAALSTNFQNVERQLLLFIALVNLRRKKPILRVSLDQPRLLKSLSIGWRHQILNFFFQKTPINEHVL